MRIASCLGALVLCACPSFKNVDATARLGIALGDQPIAVAQWTAECEAVQAVGPGLETICRARDKRYENMVLAVRGASELLQQYAVALSAAANASDVSISDSATAALDQIAAMDTEAMKASLPAVYNLAALVAKDATLVGKLTAPSVVTIVDTVVKFASRNFRRDAIARAVTEAAPHVDALAAFVEAEVQLHREDVVDLRDALRVAVSTRPLSEATPVVAQLLPLAVPTLDVRIAALDRLDAACQAFRLAHRKLAERIRDDKPWKNQEMLAEIQRDVQMIVKAVRGGSRQAAAFPPTARLAFGR